jgi:hypothetical protein
MRPLLRITLAFAAILLSSCLREANPSNFTTIAPEAQDLAGTYEPTEHTTELLKASGKYPAAKSSITLKTDGTVKIVNVPDWWLSSYGEAKGKFDNGTGAWSIDKNKNWWLVIANFPTTTASFTTTSVPAKGHVTAMLSLVGQTPPYKLQMNISDPNADLVMQYEKVAEN